ncbi:MAG: HK97 family phage prohead protease [Sphingomonadales bacterium]|nr:HK97 family phage prohead protease [Sphingomonadales bacterium]MDE2568778.1 HK97 family phage prohead protease [Sphingomonadales bacterium]
MNASPTPALASATTLRFAGYAAIFGRRDSGGDTILPGAFARTLAAHAAEHASIPVYWQHRPEQQVGWVDQVSEDRRGLRVIAHFTNPDGTPAALVRDGAVRGLSFGYRVKAAVQSPTGRDILDVDLVEVSLVTRPMQAFAQVHLVTA